MIKIPIVTIIVYMNLNSIFFIFTIIFGIVIINPAFVYHINRAAIFNLSEIIPKKIHKIRNLIHNVSLNLSFIRLKFLKNKYDKWISIYRG